MKYIIGVAPFSEDDSTPAVVITSAAFSNPEDDLALLDAVLRAMKLHHGEPAGPTWRVRKVEKLQ